jgi:site-specific DNA-methyltransferase (cytosine-N4-specific)
VDPFAGSNTTGKACEDEGRRWIAVEKERKYLEGSKLRFQSGPPSINGRKGKGIREIEPLLFS